MTNAMDAVAALVPPVVVAIAFVAVIRAAIRHTDRSPGSAEVDADQSPPEEGPASSGGS